MLLDMYREIRSLTLAVELSADKEKLQRAARFFERSDVENYGKEYGLGSETPELTALIEAMPMNDCFRWSRSNANGEYGSLERRLAGLLNELDYQVRGDTMNVCQPVSPKTLLLDTLCSVELSGNEAIQRDVASLFAQFEWAHSIRGLLQKFPAIRRYLNGSVPAAHENLALIGLNRQQNREDACGRVASLMLKFLRP